jgi:hypothetical protein
MSNIFKVLGRGAAGIFRDGLVFFKKKYRRRLVYLILLAAFAVVDFLVLGLVRRTFVFYSGIGGATAVEDRMLKRAPARELDIIRYVEEALLGPVSPDSAPLFSPETRLRSLLYRDGVVYADFSEPAALPPPEGGDVFRNLHTLDTGIRRNFSYIKEVKFFIAGHEVRISGITD